MCGAARAPAWQKRAGAPQGVYARGYPPPSVNVFLFSNSISKILFAPVPVLWFENIIFDGTFMLCSDCGQDKPSAEYYKSKHTSSGLEECCKVCALERRRRAKLNPHPGHARAKAFREISGAPVLSASEAGRGILDVEYEALLTQQQGVCKSCLKPCRMIKSRKKNPNSNRNLAVDHDHATGLVRGLLCGRCNYVLGMFEEDPESLERAAHYLRTSRTSIPYLKGQRGRLMERKLHLLTEAEGSTD